MPSSDRCDRRGFLGRSLAAAGVTGAAVGAGSSHGAAPPQGGADASKKAAQADPSGMPYGMIGKVKISRLLVGGNLISGCMHARDLRYVTRLFRAYVTEKKILETLKLAEENGVNTVFETGAAFVKQYNKEYGGHMQFIPHVDPSRADDQQIKDSVKREIDGGAVAVYVWGVAGDNLVRSGRVDRIAKAVEAAQALGVPCGVGSHSLQVPVACEKHQVPCDFYVKTLHRDDYPSATPKELRKEYIWLDGGKGWYDSMWCINPEETIEFMRTVTKPWLAYKVLAAGAIHPKQGFAHAFRNGADFIAVGMFDFQIKEDCDLAKRAVGREKDRQRPWRA